MIKALLFDLDDTLSANAPLVKKATIEALEKHGISNPTVPPELEKLFFGMKAIEINRLIVDHFSLPVSAEQLNKERNGVFYLLIDKLQPMPGLSELLSFLRSSRYKKALATASVKRFVEKKLQVLHIADVFDVMVTGDEVEKGKPDPELFLLAAKRLSVPPENCVVIEDADNGILAAKRACMKAIGVRNSVFDAHQELSAADIVVNSLAEVPEAVKSFG